MALSAFGSGRQALTALSEISVLLFLPPPLYCRPFFSPTPIKIMEKNRIGDQTLCSAFSPGQLPLSSGIVYLSSDLSL